jgi:hypothetical protein
MYFFHKIAFTSIKIYKDGHASGRIKANQVNRLPALEEEGPPLPSGPFLA